MAADADKTIQGLYDIHERLGKGVRNRAGAPAAWRQAGR